MPRLFGVVFQRQARADQVAVAVDVVYATHRWPELVLQEPRGRVGSLFAAVGVLPVGCQERVGSVGGILEEVIGPVRLPRSMASISRRIEIMASQKRSSSESDSLSVGSIITVPATGQETVGAWKP